MSIASKARAAAESLSSEAEAPANDCCAAGEQAFAISEATLSAEYDLMVEALDQAEVELIAQAEANQNAWLIAEQQIQTWSSIPNPQYANMVAKLVIAEANATEAAFGTATSELVAEIGNAEVAIQAAAEVLGAEQQEFVAEACNAEAENTEAE